MTAATVVVKWPQGDKPVCDKHLEAEKRMAGYVKSITRGAVEPVYEAATNDMECTTCEKLSRTS